MARRPIKRMAGKDRKGNLGVMNIKSNSGKTALRTLKAFLRDDRGQSTTEYILILSIVVMVVLKFKEAFVGRVTGITNQLGTKIEDAVSIE